MASLTDGLYEIRTMLAPSTLGLDAADGSTANGTNIRLYAANGTNAQKFRITSTAAGYLIVGLGSGKALDVADGKVTTEDANIQLWTSNDTAAQRWQIALSDSETATIDGVECAVGTIGAGNAGDYVADVESALAQSKTNVRIHHANQTTAQSWAFVPTTAVSDDLPAPYDMALATWKGREFHAKAGKLHPRFKCAYSIGAAYQWRYRTRRMAPSGIWGAWTAWTAWAEPSATYVKREPSNPSVRNVWIKDTVDCTFDFSECKRMECQMEVRTVSSDGTLMSRTCSAYEASGSAVEVTKDVKTTFTGACWSPLGLRIECTNDFQDAGELTYDVRNMHINGGSRWRLARRCAWENGSFLVPPDGIGGIPAKGNIVGFDYYTWQDMSASNNTWQSSTPELTVTYDGGTVRVKPTVTDGDGATMVATVPYTQTVRMWVMIDGEMIELPGTEANGKTSFTYEYPFGKDYKLFTTYANADGSEWGSDEMDMPAKSLRAHAWNWDGGWLVLWLDSDYVKESRDYGLSFDTHTLSGRSKPAVSILSDSNGDSYLEISGSVGGALLPDDRFGCTTDNVEALMRQGFARYRSPSGRVADVAVTGGSVEVNHGYASVSIDQTEVSS